MWVIAELSASLHQSHDNSEIILICWLAAQKNIYYNFLSVSKTDFYAYYFCGNGWYIIIQNFGAKNKLISTFMQQGRIQLIRTVSNDIYYGYKRFWMISVSNKCCSFELSIHKKNTLWFPQIY